MNRTIKEKLTTTPQTVEELYVYGQLGIEEIEKVTERFDLSCKKCGSVDVSIIGESGNDGYCETCTSPWTRFAIKCGKCGNGVGIRMY
jgi:formate dehydrogenase maturation protein FdhE